MAHGRRGLAARDARSTRATLRRDRAAADEDDRRRRPNDSASPTAPMFGIIASTTAPFCRDLRSQPAHGGRTLGCSVSTPTRSRPARSRSGAAPPMRRSPDRIAAGLDGSRTDRGAEAAAGDRRTAARCTRSTSLRADPRREMHTGAAAAPTRHGAARRPDRTADPAQHRQHRPALRGHRYAAPPDRAARLLAGRHAR